jgi:hypothetical protein
MRLNEHDRVAPQELLDHLESFARYEVKRIMMFHSGEAQMLGRIAYVGRAWKGQELAFVKTLERLEAQLEGCSVAMMKDYWTFRKPARVGVENHSDVIEFSATRRGNPSAHGCCTVTVALHTKHIK